MKTITALEPQKNNPNRVNVYLDGEFAFGLARIAAAWLRVGQALTDEKVASLQKEDARETAYLRAMHLLSYRARSEAEIRQRLQKHEVPEAVIEETLERLRAEGFVNDGQFASAWVANRNEFRPRSKRALAMELKQKGLTEAAIQSALEAADDEALAYEAGRKKVRRLAGLEWQEFRRKLGDFLARRGFSYSVIAPTVKRLWDEQEQ
jgi:regulatory protein